MLPLLRLILLIAVAAQPLLAAPAAAGGRLAGAPEQWGCCGATCECADRCPCLVEAPADPTPAPGRAPAPVPVDVRALLPASAVPSAVIIPPPPLAAAPAHAVDPAFSATARRALLCIWTT